jgi:hypothetical protein
MPGLSRPNESTSLELPELDEDETYIGTLLEIEERESTYTGKSKRPPRYTAEGKLVPESAIVWKFGLASPDGGKVTSDDGSPFELWSWSSTSTKLATKSTPLARAREYMHALAGRELSDDDVVDLLQEYDSGLPETLIGNKVSINVRYVPQTEGKNARYQIDRIRPYRSRKARTAPLPADDELTGEGASAPVPAPAPAPRNGSARASQSARRPRATVVEDDETP